MSTIQCAPGSVVNRFGTGLKILAHDCRVNNVTGTQASTLRYDGLSHRDGTLFHRLDFDIRSAGVLDGSSHSSTHPEMIIGRIDDRIGIHLGDIALRHIE